MVKIKLEINKRDKLIFKLKISDDNLDELRFLKRALIDSKNISGEYTHIVPLKYFIPIVSNISSSKLCLDLKSELDFLEFWDEYEEKHYYIKKATPKFMANWRKEGCPNIYRVSISRENLKISKEIVFKKLDILKNKT